MTRFPIRALCLAVLLALPATAAAETSAWASFQFGVSTGAPPPPLTAAPAMVFVGGVSVADARCADDVFRHGGTWWRYAGGWWWRSASWRGPWAAVDVRKVPVAVVQVPAGHWKRHPHGMPPGQAKKRGVAVVHQDRGVEVVAVKGKGKGKGHAPR
jgi:hypothetical protein